MPRKVVAVTAGIATLAVLCFILIGAVFCAATLHVRRVLAPAPREAKTVSIVAEGARLSAWWFRPDQSNGSCILVLHGISDSRAGSAGFAPMFLSQGYAVMVPDSRGHGASEGPFVTYGLLEKYDALAWADWMRNSGCDRVYAFGESLGASVLIQAAELRPVFAAIVAECPSRICERRPNTESGVCRVYPLFSLRR